MALYFRRRWNVHPACEKSEWFDEADLLHGPGGDQWQTDLVRQISVRWIFAPQSRVKQIENDDAL